MEICDGCDRRVREYYGGTYCRRCWQRLFGKAERLVKKIPEIEKLLGSRDQWGDDAIIEAFRIKKLTAKKLKLTFQEADTDTYVYYPSEGWVKASDEPQPSEEPQIVIEDDTSSGGSVWRVFVK